MCKLMLTNVFNSFTNLSLSLSTNIFRFSFKDKKIFTWYEGEASANELYNGRLNLITNHDDYGKATANLTAIRESDQGWYHCQIVFPNRTPSIRNNGTWYFLTVQGKCYNIFFFF